MSEYAILKDGEVVECDLSVNRQWRYEHHDDRFIGRTTEGESLVSTVFLCVNHSYGAGPDLWFETMVFGGPLDQAMDRYTTLAEAKEGHEKMCERVRRYPELEDDSE